MSETILPGGIVLPEFASPNPAPVEDEVAIALDSNLWSLALQTDKVSEQLHGLFQSEKPSFRLLLRLVDTDYCADVSVSVNDHLKRLDIKLGDSIHEYLGEQHIIGNITEAAITYTPDNLDSLSAFRRSTALAEFVPTEVTKSGIVIRPKSSYGWVGRKESDIDITSPYDPITEGRHILTLLENAQSEIIAA